MLKGRKITKVLISLLLVFVMMVSLIPGSAEAGKGGDTGKPPKNPVTSSTINYVALGDSIATGTVTNWSSITSYVTYFHQYLQGYYGRKVKVNFQNLAHDGDTTNELLAKLQNNDTVINAVIDADVITVSIGGNNLMQAAEIPGFTNIDWTLADKGVTDFNSQWDEIINIIKSLNTKNAKIIVMNVYNPYNIYPPTGYGADAGLHGETDIRISAINETIEKSMGLGYKIANVHDAYHAYSDRTMGQITYFYPSLFNYLFRNPHPNSTGQNIITELHKTAFTTY